MTFPNAKWLPTFSDLLENDDAVDKGSGLVGLPIIAHGFQAGQTVVIAGTVNYNGAFEIISETVDEVVITATYVAELFVGDETVVFGKQPILKEDIKEIGDAILDQASARMQPNLIWDDAGQVHINATPDCPVSIQFTGIPNVLNMAAQVDGGLSDGVVRTLTANELMTMATAGKLWGVEKASQWYAVYGIAANADTDFTLKSMPFLRVCSDDEGTKVISLGTILTPATGRRYGFTTDEFVGGKICILTGASAGKMRVITANNNATGGDGTSGTITYTGDALSLAGSEGIADWFIILPPGTNFRFIGTFFNNASSNISKFSRNGNLITWLDAVVETTIAGVAEEITVACPFACTVLLKPTTATSTFGHRLGTAIDSGWFQAHEEYVSEVPINYCRYYHAATGDAKAKAIGYKYDSKYGL